MLFMSNSLNSSETNDPQGFKQSTLVWIWAQLSSKQNVLCFAFDFYLNRKILKVDCNREWPWATVKKWPVFVEQTVQSFLNIELHLHSSSYEKTP